MLNVAMHWYAFQMFTMRFVCTSGVSTWHSPSNSFQYSPSLLNAASAFAATRYLAIAAFADFLLMTCESGGSNFSSRGFSWYPSTNTICRDSPGLSDTLRSEEHTSELQSHHE